jgi:predicted HAD superfamily Cof-like phosphohydrolase
MTTMKHKVQEDVEKFHRALDVPVATTPRLPEKDRLELRATLIAEEARETVIALRLGDFLEAVDGLCDLLCVVYGTAAEMGVDLAPFWNEVQRANMAKQGGPTRADGKKLKPEGWQPPDHVEVLQQQLGATITLDGDKLCALVGPDLQEGQAGFGDSEEEALLNLMAGMYVDEKAAAS